MQSPLPANATSAPTFPADEHSGIRHTPNRLLIWLLIAVFTPAAIAFWILYRQQFSLPYQDDYGAILEFATEYRNLSSLPAKLLYVATKQDNDYKLGFEHSIVAMQLGLLGHLNFGFLVTAGNLFLPAIAYTLWRIFRRKDLTLNQQLLEFIPVSLLFFSLAYWESLDWAMATLQNLPVILFSLLAIYLFTPQEAGELPAKRFWLSCICAILASMSSANGFLLGPIGLFHFWRRRSLSSALAWSSAFIIPMAAYLYHYRVYHVSVGTMHNGAYVAKAAYFLAFLGCAIPSRVLAALAGVVIFIVLALAGWKRFDRTNPAAFYSMVWVVATAGLVGFLRQTLASRYSIYSLLALIFCYCFLAQLIQLSAWAENQNRFYAVSIFLALVFCALTDRQANQHLRERRLLVLAGMEHYRANPEVNAPTIDPELLKYHPDQPAAERNSLNNAIHEKVYTVPPPQ